MPIFIIKISDEVLAKLRNVMRIDKTGNVGIGMPTYDEELIKDAIADMPIKKSRN